MRLLFSILSVLPLLMRGQYTYFNNYLPPPHPEVGSGFVTNLFIYGDTIITFNVSPSANGIERNHYMLDLNGDVLDQLDYSLENGGFMFGQYSESALPINEGYVYATGYSDNSMPKMRGRVTGYNSSFEENWHYDLDQYQADSVDASQYGCVSQLNNGDFVAAGWVSVDSIEDENSWVTNCNFLLTKLNSSGEVLWHWEYPFHLDQYFSLPQKFLRTNQIFELTNGDLIVWGNWYDQYDPFVIKFNSDGVFLEEKHWGNPTLDDWLPWPVQVSDYEFMFVYSNALSLSVLEQTIHNIKIGKFNALDMSIEWIGTYDYQHHWGGIMDFEQTPDEGFVVLGYGGNPSIPNFMGEAYLLKIDALGNEEWYQTFQPPVANFFTPQAYDLEITPDGGLVFAGSFEHADAGYYATWLVKTDACGDEVFNGCTTSVQGFKDSKIQGFELYPNPSSEHVNVSCEQEIHSISIRDIAGKIVLSEALRNHSFQTQVDVSLLAPGMYLVEVDFGNGKIAAERIVKE